MRIIGAVALSVIAASSAYAQSAAPSCAAMRVESRAEWNAYLAECASGRLRPDPRAEQDAQDQALRDRFDRIDLEFWKADQRQAEDTLRARRQADADRREFDSRIRDLRRRVDEIDPY